jgi:hypothetical protein
VKSKRNDNYQRKNQENETSRSNTSNKIKKETNKKKTKKARQAVVACTLPWRARPRACDGSGW